MPKEEALPPLVSLEAEPQEMHSQPLAGNEAKYSSLTDVRAGGPRPYDVNIRYKT